MPICAAWWSTGPLANPPTPTTNSGRKRRRMRRAFHRELISLNGNNQLRRLRQLRSTPVIQSPLMAYPAAGTFSISIRPLAPTNRMSHCGCRRLISSAMAKAGWMWPPVPPPETITRLRGCEESAMGLGFTDDSVARRPRFLGGFFPIIGVGHGPGYGQNHADGEAGENHGSSAVRDHGQGLPGRGE